MHRLVLRLQTKPCAAGLREAAPRPQRHRCAPCCAQASQVWLGLPPAPLTCSISALCASSSTRRQLCCTARLLWCSCRPASQVASGKRAASSAPTDRSPSAGIVAATKTYWRRQLGPCTPGARAPSCLSPHSCCCCCCCSSAAGPLPLPLLLPLPLGACRRGRKPASSSASAPPRSAARRRW